MHVGIKTLMWRSVGVVALLVAANTASAERLFDLSTGSDWNRLIINGDISNGLKSGDNQGWWSNEHVNLAGNVSYLVGQYTDDNGKVGDMNNFFVFDISTLNEPVTSAVLQLQSFNAIAGVGVTTILYSLFDVTTEISVLNQKGAPVLAIYNDLGSGTYYGSEPVATDLPMGGLVEVTLNAAGLVDLNKAIGDDARYFAIGGTLSFTPVAAPTSNPVPDSANTLALLALAVACLWSVRRPKQAA